jgi:hypothetical protein
MTWFQKILPGYKTYIAAIAVIATAIAAFANGDATLMEAINQGLVGLGLAGLRAAK